MTSVLMVCTGNICRSPAAEAVLRRALTEAGMASQVRVDSAGTTDWHEGEPAHEFSRTVGARRGSDVGHRSRPFIDDDFERFDLLLVMDGSHERSLLDRATRRGNPLGVGTLRYLRSFDPLCTPTTGLDDPWGNPVSAYERMYDEIEASVPGLVAHLVSRVTSLLRNSRPDSAVAASSSLRLDKAGAASCVLATTKSDSRIPRAAYDSGH